MDKSTLYNELSRSVIQEWRRKEEKEEEYFAEKERELNEELKAAMNEDSAGLLESYALAIQDRMDAVQYGLHVRILNLGIQIGMELERAFQEPDEEY